MRNRLSLKKLEVQQGNIICEVIDGHGAECKCNFVDKQVVFPRIRVTEFAGCWGKK